MSSSHLGFICPWCEGTCNEPGKRVDEPCGLCAGQGRLKGCKGCGERLVPTDMPYCSGCLASRLRPLPIA